jgi:DNA-binding Lrp family transcriptional regulator
MTGVKIDEINANIIKALLADARTSFTAMAKQNNITVVAVRSRYENLRKTGVINGAIMQINPASLGFNCTGYLGLSVNPEKTEEIKEFLNKEPYILSTWNKIQEVNLAAFFAMPNLEYFNSVSDKLKSYPHIKSIQPLIYVGFLVSDHPENLIIKTDVDVEPLTDVEKKSHPLKQEPLHPQLRNKTYVHPPEMQQISNVDRQIAKMLSEDARTPFSSIAKKLNLSTSHIIKKYQKLKKRELFLRSTVTLDLRKLGYKANAMIYLKIEIGTDFAQLQKQLLAIPNLIILVKTIGESDMLAITPIATFEDLFKIEAKFRNIKGVNVVQINVNPTFQQWPFNYFAQVL